MLRSSVGLRVVRGEIEFFAGLHLPASGRGFRVEQLAKPSASKLTMPIENKAFRANGEEDRREDDCHELLNEVEDCCLV